MKGYFRKSIFGGGLYLIPPEFIRIYDHAQEGHKHEKYRMASDGMRQSDLIQRVRDFDLSYKEYLIDEEKQYEVNE